MNSPQTTNTANSANSANSANTANSAIPGAVDSSWVQNAYNDDGTLKRGDWAGDINDTNNAMDDLLNSDKFNNGRVPDVSMVDNVTRTSEGDVIIRNDTQQIGVKGIVEETVLSDTFFSEMNTKVIQDTIRYRVYIKTNLVIDYQSEQELFIIMRSILLQHANFKIGQKDLIKEIQKLNKMVVDYSANEVSSNVTQYQGYINDLEKLPVPLDRPAFDPNTGSTTYDMSNHIGIAPSNSSS
jgi:hypothetical protein